MLAGEAFKLAAAGKCRMWARVATRAHGGWTRDEETTEHNSFVVLIAINPGRYYPDDRFGIEVVGDGGWMRFRRYLSP